MPTKAEKHNPKTAKQKLLERRTRAGKKPVARKKQKIEYERLEAKLSPETKRLAERAALVSELTLTDYLAKLIKEDAPKTIKTYTEIQLTNQQFDDFISLCESTEKPSKEIINAAKLLDNEGF